MSPSRMLGFFALVVASACATPAAQGGLSNAPDENRPWGPEDRGHDVIANGRDSCPPSMKKEDDPLPNRRPRCVEARPITSTTASARPTSPPPPP